MNLPLLKRKAIALFFFSFLLVLSTNSQAQAPAPSQTIVDKANKYNESLPGERLYLHFDKPNYAIGDTIWFKGYLVNAALAYSPLSSRLYVDLINDSNKIVQHFIFPVSVGLSVGNIFLDEKFIHEGNYTIRAYTNWMRNFSQDQFFYHNFYVARPNKNTMLVNGNFSATGNDVKADLKFSGLNDQSAGSHDFEISLIDDKKTIQHNTAQTQANGSLNLNFNLPGNTPVKNLALIVQDKKENFTERIPVAVNRATDVDVQFMPEGGQLVASLPAHVGFKAIGEDGKGVAIKGVLLDKENNEYANFAQIHNGMGVFDFVPQPGEVYTAKITLPNGEIKSVAFPPVKDSGTVLKIKNTQSDSLQVSAFSSKDVQNTAGDYTIIGQSRGAVCYAATFKLNRDIVNFQVSKSLFPTGVAHFTLFNPQNQPLNERISFINHHDDLKLKINTGAMSFNSRDSIPMHITVKDEKGDPVVGSFSLAVTDDGQVEETGAGNTNILSQLLMAADLKGYIENPAWYFSSGDNTALPLDVLLLTQGWVNYNWQDILNDPKPSVFTAEPEYAINGKVTNLVNAPIPNLNVTLISTGKLRLFKDTTTNASGHFTFNNFPPITDSITFVLQARRAKGRIVNAGISINEIKTPTVELPNFPIYTPWYVNSNDSALNTARYRDKLTGIRNGNSNHVLDMVTVRGKAIIKGSYNLNGPGNSDQSIIQEDLEKMGKVSLLKVLEQKVTDFRENYSGSGKGHSLTFLIKEKRVHFSIDGVDLDQLYEKQDNALPDDHYNYLKNILEYFSAEDITGIEVLYNQEYTALYNNRFSDNPASPANNNIAYIEITTRSGQGPYQNRANGIFVYHPAPLNLPAQFYRPKYPIKSNQFKTTDIRSTIHWEPNIVTDKNGEAVTYFYAADPSTTYTIILQGANLNGKVGYATQKITITGKK